MISSEWFITVTATPMPVMDGGLLWCKNKNAATITSIATMDRAIFIDVSCGLNSMPGSPPSEQKLENFLNDLARNRNLAAYTQTQAFNAILFFYKEVLRQPRKDIDALRTSRPARMRSAPTVPETQPLL